MEPGKGVGEAYLIADEEYVTIETLVRKTGTALGVDVDVPHYPIMPLVIAGHICEKVCKPFKITPPIFRAGWIGSARIGPLISARQNGILGMIPRLIWMKA